MLTLKNKTWLWVLLLCLGLGTGVTAVWAPGITRRFNPFELALFWLVFPVFIGANLFFFPYGFILLALARLRKRRTEIENMDETLAEVSQEVSDRKLREFVATRNGLESYMGLVERTHAHDVAKARSLVKMMCARGHCAKNRPPRKSTATGCGTRGSCGTR